VRPSKIRRTSSARISWQRSADHRVRAGRFW